MGLLLIILAVFLIVLLSDSPRTPYNGHHTHNHSIMIPPTIHEYPRNNDLWYMAMIAKERTNCFIATLIFVFLLFVFIYF
jgi:integral membrane sensor domain MASE1